MNSTPFPGGLSVFFPCYDEEENLEYVVRDALDALAPLAPDLELIVVDDGSRDRTAEIAARLALEDERVRLVRHEQNRGYGAALRTGIESATGAFIFYTDGDFQFRMADIERLIPLIPEADIVSAYRIARRDSPLRAFLSRSFGLLCRLLLRLQVRDIDCAFKLFRREVFDGMELRCGGAVIDAEILTRAQRKGCRIAQVGVPHHPRGAGRQTGADPRVILRALRELLSLALERDR